MTPIGHNSQQTPPISTSHLFRETPPSFLFCFSWKIFLSCQFGMFVTAKNEIAKPVRWFFLSRHDKIWCSKSPRPWKDLNLWCAPTVPICALEENGWLQMHTPRIFDFCSSFFLRFLSLQRISSSCLFLVSGNISFIRQHLFTVSVTLINKCQTQALFIRMLFFEILEADQLHKSWLDTPLLFFFDTRNAGKSGRHEEMK